MFGYAGIRACLPVHSNSKSLVQALFISPQTSLPTLSQLHSDKNILHLHGISFLGRRVDVSLEASSRLIRIKLNSGEPLLATEADPTRLDHLCMDSSMKKSWSISMNDPQPLVLPYMSYWLHA